MTAKFKIDDFVQSTNSGKLYAIKGVMPLDDHGSFAYRVVGIRDGKRYGPVRTIAESGLCAESKRPESVVRFVATYMKGADRTLMTAAQGRNTYATAAEAQAWIDAVTTVNSADTIRQIWGDNPRFQVRACDCWPGHFDPKGVYFD